MARSLGAGVLLRRIPAGDHAQGVEQVLELFSADRPGQPEVSHYRCGVGSLWRPLRPLSGGLQSSFPSHEFVIDASSLLRTRAGTRTSFLRSTPVRVLGRTDNLGDAREVEPRGARVSGPGVAAAELAGSPAELAPRSGAGLGREALLFKAQTCVCERLPPSNLRG